MSGICGFFSQRPITEQQLWDMTSAMTHRGPDSAGIWLDEDNGYHVGYGHRRLSVIDLSKSAHQPMKTDDGSIVITFDGRIYNSSELRAELEKKGCRFQSNCDAEVLLNAYKEWGDECISKIEGMFAFAIYDKQRHRAILVRDPIGEKPLYYYRNGQTLIFGSELKPLMKHPEFVKDIDFEFLSAYLIDRFYPPPCTVFKDTIKLEPGCMLIWENGAVTKQEYWDLLEKHHEGAASLIHDANEAKESLKLCIQKSIKQRLAADVPVGAFLSGGIDSTIIAGMANDAPDKPLKTFTVGFSETEYNEAGSAKMIAEHLGTEHTDFFISEEDALSLVAGIPQCYDEPFADSTQIPLMLAFRLAKEAAGVVLSGDGADRLFCDRTDYHVRRNPVRTAVGVARDIKRILYSDMIAELQPGKHKTDIVRSLIEKRHYAKELRLRDVIYETVAHKMVKQESHIKFKVRKEIVCTNPLERHMLLDMLATIPEKAMPKVERASMHYGLETRFPYMNTNVIEHSFRIPMELKYRNGEKKWILKQVAYDMVPRALLEKPKKGFTAPLGKWLRGPLKQMVDKYADEEILRKQDIFDFDTVKWLIDDLTRTGGEYKRILWSFLVFQLWYQEYVEDLW